jgi:hypothetical protein
MPGRRDFLRTTAGTLACLLSERGLSAWEIGHQAAASGPPVKLAIIGLGRWGREILTALARVPSADVGMICDVYAPAVRRAAEIVPGATGVADFRRALDSPAIDAIVVTTPTSMHGPIATAALDAGKHVYCEAPLAASFDDARAITVAARAHPTQVFQGGLQGRSNQLYRHVSQFVKSGVLGDIAAARQQGCRCRRGGDARPLARPDGCRRADRRQAPLHRETHDPAPGRGVQAPRHGEEDPGHRSGRFAWLQRSEVPPRPCDREGGHRGATALGANLTLGGGRLQIAPERPFVEELDARDETPPDAGESHVKHMRNFLESIRANVPANCNEDLGLRVQTIVSMAELAYRKQKLVRFDDRARAIA